MSTPPAALNRLHDAARTTDPGFGFPDTRAAVIQKSIHAIPPAPRLELYKNVSARAKPCILAPRRIGRMLRSVDLGITHVAPPPALGGGQYVQHQMFFDLFGEQRSRLAASRRGVP